jgi:sialidase-1
MANLRTSSRLFCGSTSRLWAAILLFAVFAGRGVAEELTAGCRQQDVFVGGTEGYHTYRIPALVVSKQGTLLAFCEGRKLHTGDSGDIDLLLKRSADQGKTWTERQIVWNDRHHTCGNPCPVVDQQTGAIWLLLTWNRGDDTEHQIISQTSKDSRRVFVCHSDDDGATWSQPKDITADVKRPNWTWYATGPGNGIQLTRSPHNGRLAIPCDHIEATTRKAFSHVIYSDDHGRSWQLGGTCPNSGTNECAVVELADGRLMLNMRNYETGKKGRAVCFSRDGGATWGDRSYDQTLVEPICQASILRLRWPDQGGASRILFSNPASAQREKMTIRLSNDEGKTWPAATMVHAGPAAYSCLAALPDGSIGCLYERGDANPYQRITLAILDADALIRE